MSIGLLNGIINRRATPMWSADTLANRPAAGIAGQEFTRTDSPYGIYRDTGVTWVLVAGTPGSSMPTLQNVTTAGAVTVDVITAAGFVKSGGLAAQFLKADGSIDSNTYVTSYGSLQQVTTIGNITTLGIEVRGSLSSFGLDNNVSPNRLQIRGSQNDSYIDFLDTNASVTSWGVAKNAGSADLAIKRYVAGVFTDTPFLVSKSTGLITAAGITATYFARPGGLSTQFLKADGSIDSNSYVTGYGSLQLVTNVGSTTSNPITANSFIKSGGTSAQFLKADGSVDGNTYVTGYGSLQQVTTVGNITTLGIEVRGSLSSFGLDNNVSANRLQIRGSQNDSYIDFLDTNASVTSWGVAKNAGSADLAIKRYVAGVFTDTPFLVSKSTGLITAAGITATYFARPGGLSTQFLKADGSVDSNTYVTGYGSLQQVTTIGNTTTNAIVISAAGSSITKGAAGVALAIADSQNGNGISIAKSAGTGDAINISVGTAQFNNAQTFSGNNNLWSAINTNSVSGTGFTNTVEIIVAGLVGQLSWTATGANVVLDNSPAAAVVGRTYYNTAGGVNRIGAVNGSVLFASSGNVTMGATLIAAVPRQQSGQPAYTGVISAYAGLLIDDITTNSDIIARITRAYGIYQAGASDFNYLNGKTLFGTTTNGLGKVIVQSAGNQAVTLRNGTTPDRFQLFVGDGGGGFTADVNYIVNNNTDLFVLNTGGGVKLVNGTSIWAVASDMRKKTDIVPITGALDKISKVQSFTGRMITDPETMRRAMLSANDVHKVLPEAVSIDAEGFYWLRYEETIPLIFAAINELAAIQKKNNAN